MTAFEIVIDVVTSVCTVGATIAAAISASKAAKNVKYLTQVQYKTKNLEDIKSVAIGKDKADIIFTNNSGADALIERLVCIIGDTVFDAHTLLLDNEPVKLPVVLKSQHSIKIKSVKEQALYYFSIHKRRRVLSTDNIKIRFTLIDSQANESSIESNHYLNDYSDYNFFNKDLLPEFLDKVDFFAKVSNKGCIYIGTTNDNFSLYCFYKYSDFSDTLKFIEQYKEQDYMCDADNFGAHTIAVCEGGNKKYYRFENFHVLDDFIKDIAQFSTEIRSLEMEYLDIDDIMRHHKLT